MAGFEPHIWCPDLSSALHFYTDILGFGIVAQNPDGAAATWYQLQRDEHTLMLASMPSQTNPDGNQGYVSQVGDRLSHGGPLSLYVHVNAAPDAMYAKAQSLGVRVIETIWNPWWGGRQFTVVDPSGVWITISGPVPGSESSRG